MIGNTLVATILFRNSDIYNFQLRRAFAKSTGNPELYLRDWPMLEQLARTRCATIQPIAQSTQIPMSVRPLTQAAQHVLTAAAAVPVQASTVAVVDTDAAPAVQSDPPRQHSIIEAINAPVLLQPQEFNGCDASGAPKSRKSKTTKTKQPKQQAPMDFVSVFYFTCLFLSLHVGILVGGEQFQ